MFTKIPLAWLQLTHERIRMLVAISGIAFAVALIFIQMGFQDALYDGSMRPHQALNADLVMIHPQFETFFSVKSFSRTRLYEILAIPGVESVTALHVGKGIWKNPSNKVNRDILVFACDPLKVPFKMPGLAHDMLELRKLNRVLFDIGSRPEFGPVEKLLKSNGEFKTELNERAVCTTGSFFMGASFASDGNLLASDSTFLNIFPGHKAEQVELGLIKLAPGANEKIVQEIARKSLGSGVDILSTKELAAREKAYWATSTGIGFIFGLGVFVGFAVGVVVVYQILYSDVADHLPQYATLKAIGYNNKYLSSILMQEALILALAGYIPGIFISVSIYEIARGATLLPIAMTTTRAGIVFLMTMFMCIGSALLAARKLGEADPAEIF